MKGYLSKRKGSLFFQGQIRKENSIALNSNRKGELFDYSELFLSVSNN